MQESKKLANEVLAMIEEYYPEFLAESGLADNNLIKAAFYETMLTTVKETPLPDDEAMRMIEVALTRLAMNARTSLMLFILHRMN